MYQGYFLTVDLGEIDDKGIIRLVGRLKFEINRAGMKINPEELDSLLEQNGIVSEACTFGIPDDVAGELVGIAVVLDSEDFSISELDERKILTQLKSWVRERVVAEKVPDRWYILSKIKKTDRGKVSRNQVAEECMERHSFY